MTELYEAIYTIVTICAHSNLCDELEIKENNGYIHSDLPYKARIALPNNITITYQDSYVNTRKKFKCELHYLVRIIDGVRPMHDIYYRKKINKTFLNETFEKKWSKLKNFTNLEYEGKNFNDYPNRNLSEEQIVGIIEYSKNLQSKLDDYLNNKPSKTKKLIK